MATSTDTTLGAIFDTRNGAVRAVEELQRGGFDKSHIGIVGRDAETGKIQKQNADETHAEEGAAVGAAVGAGAGALVGLGVLSGVIPVVGPAIAAGTLGVIFSNLAAGAAIAGVAGTLIGFGIPEEDAEYYETELKSGKTLVTVQTDNRMTDALRILQANGGRVKPLTHGNRPV